MIVRYSEGRMSVQYWVLAFSHTQRSGTVVGRWVKQASGGCETVGRVFGRSASARPRFDGEALHTVRGLLCFTLACAMLLEEIFFV